LTEDVRAAVGTVLDFVEIQKSSSQQSASLEESSQSPHSQNTDATSDKTINAIDLQDLGIANFVFSAYPLCLVWIFLLAAYIGPTFDVIPSGCSNTALYAVGQPLPHATQSFYLERFGVSSFVDASKWYLQKWCFRPHQGLCPYALKQDGNYSISLDYPGYKNFGTSTSNAWGGCIRPNSPLSDTVFADWDAANLLQSPSVVSSTSTAWVDYQRFLDIGKGVLILAVVLQIVVWASIGIGFATLEELRHRCVFGVNDYSGDTLVLGGSEDGDSNAPGILFMGILDMGIVGLWLGLVIKMEGIVTNSQFRDTSVWQPFFPTCSVEVVRKDAANCVTAALVCCVLLLVGRAYFLTVVYRAHGKTVIRSHEQAVKDSAELLQENRRWLLPDVSDVSTSSNSSNSSSGRVLRIISVDEYYIAHYKVVDFIRSIERQEQENPSLREPERETAKAHIERMERIQAERSRFLPVITAYLAERTHTSAVVTRMAQIDPAAMG
jgi:hypothetical protein